MKILFDLGVLAVGLLAVALWSMSSRRGFAELLVLVIDKATPRLLTRVPTRALVVFSGFHAVVSIYAITDEASSDSVRSGANGLFFWLVCAVVLNGRLIWRRHAR